MKIFFSVLIVLFIAASSYCKSGRDEVRYTAGAGVSSDSVNIRQLVAAQIEHARKEQVLEKSNRKRMVSKVPVNSYNAVDKSLLNNMPGSLNAYYKTVLKISFLGFISIIAALIIYFRRRLRVRTAFVNKTFKDNIKLLREEKLFVKNNPKLSKLRNELGSSPEAFNYSKERISKTAKDMNISKGEILLAAKIKAHQLNKNQTI